MDPSLFKTVDPVISISHLIPGNEINEVHEPILGDTFIPKESAHTIKARNTEDTLVPVKTKFKDTTAKFTRDGLKRISKSASKTAAQLIVSQAPFTLPIVKMCSSSAVRRTVRFGSGLVLKPLKKSIKSLDAPENKAIKTLLVCTGQLDTTMFKDVSTPSKMFAPVLKSSHVAETVVDRIQQGKSGSLYLPLYARLVPGLKGFPTRVVKIARWWSGMDKAVKK